MSERREGCEHRRVTPVGPPAAVKDAETGRKFVQTVGLCRECGTLVRRRTPPSPYGPWEAVSPGQLANGTDAA